MTRPDKPPEAVGAYLARVLGLARAAAHLAAGRVYVRGERVTDPTRVLRDGDTVTLR